MRENELNIFEGRALIGEELEERNVRIVTEGRKIKSIEETGKDYDTWICPSFFNSHTHLGDTVAMDIAFSGSLKEIVKPPGGLKHRILEKTPHEELKKAIRASIKTMIGSGTSGCADFREGGTEGVKALIDASAGLPFSPVIFGREGGEFISDGVGISSTKDVNGVEKIVREARSAGKKVAFHAGEKNNGDIEPALEFDPDLLVHCTHATKADMRHIADRGIPVVVCARSNWIFGVTDSGKRPPVTEMLDHGIEVLLGTDNVMVVQPDMFSEMSFLSTVTKTGAESILRAALHGSALFGEPNYLKEGNHASFFIIDTIGTNLSFSMDMKKTIVDRISLPVGIQSVFS